MHEPVTEWVHLWVQPLPQTPARGGEPVQGLGMDRQACGTGSIDPVRLTYFTGGSWTGSNATPQR